MDHVRYPRLFQPLQIRHVRFRNRIFSAPVQTSYLDGMGYYTDYAIEYFQKRPGEGPPW